MRVPALNHKIGPVISSSYRLASRIANTLRAGKPVRSARELQPFAVVLLCVPGGLPSQLVCGPFLSSIDWSHKAVLVCDGPLEPELSFALRARGAAVGMLCPVSALPGSFLISGDRAALKAAKQLVRALSANAIEIPADEVILFQAALTLASSLFTPLIETAMECLRQSGLAQPLAAKTADLLFQHALRSFKHSGRKSWSGLVAAADRPAADAQFRALRQIKPEMADYFEAAAKFSFHLYQTFPELTRYNKERWKQFQKLYPERS